jgi:hypothetical protein
LEPHHARSSPQPIPQGGREKAERFKLPLPLRGRVGVGEPGKMPSFPFQTHRSRQKSVSRSYRTRSRRRQDAPSRDIVPQRQQ